MRRWTLTERSHGAVERTPDRLSIGPSALSWDGNGLTIAIDEVATPIGRSVRGTVRVVPQAIAQTEYPLDPQGRHRWQPVAPRARVAVTMDAPSLRWSGDGYFDINAGDEPLEDRFERWDWSCARLGDGAAVLYDVTHRDGDRQGLALRFDRAGGAEAFAAPAEAALPTTTWGLPRRIRSEAGRPALLKTLENGPFYARSVLRTRLFGEETTAMHESLSLTRFRRPWVQRLLPYRIPRAAR